jgi:hypothetical protein
MVNENHQIVCVGGSNPTPKPKQSVGNAKIILEKRNKTLSRILCAVMKGDMKANGNEP